MESRHSPATTHRCEAKIRAVGTCLVRVEPGKSRCRFHGGLSTGRRPSKAVPASLRRSGVGLVSPSND
jgi:hypothetical protein